MSIRNSINSNFNKISVAIPEKSLHDLCIDTFKKPEYLNGNYINKENTNQKYTLENKFNPQQYEKTNNNILMIRNELVKVIQESEKIKIEIKELKTYLENIIELNINYFNQKILKCRNTKLIMENGTIKEKPIEQKKNMIIRLNKTKEQKENDDNYFYNNCSKNYSSSNKNEKNIDFNYQDSYNNQKNKQKYGTYFFENSANTDSIYASVNTIYQETENNNLIKKNKTKNVGSTKTVKNNSPKTDTKYNIIQKYYGLNSQTYNFE